MSKTEVGKYYYFRNTKSVVKTLSAENKYGNIDVEVIFTDGALIKKGSKGYTNAKDFINKTIALWL